MALLDAIAVAWLIVGSFMAIFALGFQVTSIPGILLYLSPSIAWLAYSIYVSKTKK